MLMGGSTQFLKMFSIILHNSLGQLIKVMLHGHGNGTISGNIKVYNLNLIYLNGILNNKIRLALIFSNRRILLRTIRTIFANNFLVK